MLRAPVSSGALAFQALAEGAAEVSGMVETLTSTVGTGLGVGVMLVVPSAGLSVITPSSVLAQPESTHTSAAALS